MEAGHARPLQTVFGAVEVTHLAYRRRGERNLCAADATLNLPRELYSHGLRELSALNSPDGDNWRHDRRLALHSDDWRLWRMLRRAALAEAPAAFGSTLAGWSGAGDVERRWRGRLEDVALNLALTLDGKPVGMISATAPDPEGIVELISLWVAPGARGRGVGDEAVRQVLAWARSKHPASQVVLSVKTSNQPARLLYQRHGFSDAGPSPDDPDEELMRHHGTAL